MLTFPGFPSWMTALSVRDTPGRRTKRAGRQPKKSRETTEKEQGDAPHVLGGDDAVIIEVNAPVPILEAGVRRLVLLAKNEIDEVFVAHLAWCGAGHTARGTAEDALHNPVCKAMSAIPQEVVPINHEVVILIKLPELHTRLRIAIDSCMQTTLTSDC
jgi:hypothetical protein